MLPRRRIARVLVRLAAVIATASSVACDYGTDYSPPTTNVQFSTTDIRVGNGATAAAGQRVRVLYTGWLYSETATDHKGMQIDSNVGGQGTTFTLANGSVIAGWVQGIPGMREGGQRRLTIPDSLAYGAAGSGPVPPYAPLVFDVELVEIVQ